VSRWKTPVLVLAVAVAVWLLHPSRQLGPGTPDATVVEISFMGPGGPISGAMEDAVREFERRSEEAHARDPSHPVYRVISGQSAARNQTEDPTRFLVAVAGGAPPDVIFFDRYAVAEWAGRGAFTPLDGYIQRDIDAVKSGARTDITLKEVPTRDRFFAPCWEEAMYNGKVYAIANTVDDRALYYNEDLLVRAELVYKDGPMKGKARPPKNWEELKEYAVKLTEFDKAGRLKVVGFAPNYGNSWLYFYGWMAGAKFMSDDGKTCTLNDPGVVRGLTFMKEIYDAVGQSGQGESGYSKVEAFRADLRGMSGAQDPFIQGRIAMKIDGVWVMSHLASYARDMNFGVAPAPLPQDRIDVLEAEGKKPLLSWCGGWSYAIPTTARNKDAAWEFIRFMMSDWSIKIQQENRRAEAEAQGRLFIPKQMPLKGINEEFYEQYVADNDQLSQRFKDACCVFNDLLPYSRFRPVTPVGQVLWNAHIYSMEDALLNKRTPQEALDHHTAIVQRHLDKVLAPPKGKAVTSWTWFLAAYVGLLLLMGALVYLWDTKAVFRQAIAKPLRIGRKPGSGVIEGSRGGYFRKQWVEGVVCASPWLIGFAVFAGGPMLFSLVMSFCDFDVINPARLVGMANFREMFGADELFPTALYNTLFMVTGVPLGMAVSLAMAMLLNLKVKGIAVWRTFFYLPSIVPMVAASILWIYIFKPQGGLLNTLLGFIGLDGPAWLQDEVWSKPSIILMGLWGAGGGMIIWLAGLKGINAQLYEAASIDGANGWQKFIHVTIPQLTPYIFFNLIMGVIATFQIFGQAFIMTQGGPANSTLFYVYYLFNCAFRYGRMGYAAALAWILFAIVFVLTLIQMKLSKKWVYYEAE